MCRNIKQLYNFEPPATDDEVRAAAVQFVRKVSGFQKPSAANAIAFESAVEEITCVSQKLLSALVTKAKPRDRDTEREKAQTRNRLRYGESS